MSRIAFNGNALGTGTVTIASPNTNSDRTVTLPDETGTVVLSGGAGSFSTLAYSSTFTGGTGVVNLGSGQFYKDASGNVGIGTSSPTNGKLVITGSSVTTAQGIRLTGDTADARFICESATLGAGILGTFSNHSQLFYTNSTERMRIADSGNVGVGTSNPVVKLQVTTANGAALPPTSGTTPSTGELIRLRTSADAAGGIGTIGLATNQMWLQACDATSLGAYYQLLLNPNGGDVLLGTPSQIQGAKFSVNGNIAAQQTYGPMFISNEDNTDNVGRSSFNFLRGGTLVGQITTTNSTCSYTSVSDYRLKESVAPMTGALARVGALKPVTYKWKANGLDGQGFIAHELQAVVPDCVTGEKDAVDADGNPVYQGIDTSFLVATLTAAIQEQQAIIESLMVRIAALENK